MRRRCNALTSPAKAASRTTSKGDGIDAKMQMLMSRQLRPLGQKPRGRKRTTKLPRNPLIYHAKLLDFVMVCNGLQYPAIPPQTTTFMGL